MDTNKEMSKTDEIEKRPEFVAYNQAVEDAKEAIRGEHVDDPNAASTFINAIARKCSPHVYVNRLDAGGERCAKCSLCIRCGHNHLVNGECWHVFIDKTLCGCKCVFPAPPEAETITERLTECNGWPCTVPTHTHYASAPAPCPVCKFHWNQVVVPGEPHNRNCPYYEEPNITSTPVLAEAAAQDEVSCPDCVEGKITAGCAIDRPLISVDCGRCKGTGRIKLPTINLPFSLDDIRKKASQPSTATNSAAVEAAKEIDGYLSRTIYIAITSFARSDIAAIISKHFPPTEAAIPAVSEDDYVAWCRYTYDESGSIKSIVTCDSDAKGAFKVYRAVPDSTARANAIDEAIATCGDIVTLNRECAADSSDERSQYAYECYAMGAEQSVAALEALKQKQT